MKQEASYFVKVDDPLNVRRSLLEVNKDVLVTLSKYERFKQLRKQRHAAVQNLKEICGELNGFMSELRTHLPKLSTSLGDDLLKKKLKTAVKQVNKPKKSASELDKIEQKIREIEQRIEKVK